MNEYQEVNMNNKKAFTLIELLVVIAIIAILAAILFPVFAQAKEAAKKTQTLSNAKNQSIGGMLYADSNDDTNPLAAAADTAGGGWWWNYTAYTPAGWRGGASNQHPWKTEEEAQFANSLQAYMKSKKIVEIAGAPIQNRFTTAGIAVPQDNGFTFNGLLNSLSTTSAVDPASLIIFWNAEGKTNVRGEIIHNPALICNAGPGPCIYNPGRHPQTGVVGRGATLFFGGNCTGNPTTDRNGTSMKIHGDDAIYVYADGHAKAQKVGMQNAPNDTDARVDPGVNYYPGGRCPQNYWTTNDGTYPYLFRPDYQP